MTQGGASPANINTDAFEIVNYYGYCLDANDSGSTAGKNGDKIQLWTCTGKSNQYWYLGSASGSYNVIHNDQYTSECLNANDNGGVADGRPVQLWSCSVNTSNEYWDAEDWANYWLMGFNSNLYLQDGTREFVLDAVSQDIGDGDKVQIWTNNAGDNQYWSPCDGCVG